MDCGQQKHGGNLLEHSANHGAVSDTPGGALTTAGIRQIELDVTQDPKGGLFATAAGLKLAGGNGTLANPQYMQPGLKVN